MRIIGAIAIIVGGLAQLLLNGQVFTNAVVGVVCGVVALACGIGIAREEGPDARTGPVMLFFGVVLAVWCALTLPSAYEHQQRFNDRQNRFRKAKENQDKSEISNRKSSIA